MITDADVVEFQELYHKRFNRTINHDEAYKKLTLLVRQMEIIYQPITKSQYEAFMSNEYGDENGRTTPSNQSS